jgi:hypothetical protein
MIADPPPGLLDGWSIWAQRPLTPNKVLCQITLVVEDASPDSVIGTILLLMRLGGIDLGSPGKQEVPSYL